MSFYDDILNYYGAIQSFIIFTIENLHKLITLPVLALRVLSKTNANDFCFIFLLMTSSLKKGYNF